MEGTHEPLVSQELFDRANEKAFTHIPKKIVKSRKPSPLLFCPYCDRYMSFGGGRHLNYRCSQASKTGIKECAESKINRELLENLILTCTKEMANLLSADLERRKKQWSESQRLAEEAETLQNEISMFQTASKICSCVRTMPGLEARSIRVLYSRRVRFISSPF